jgi:hypothetical protein
VDAGGDEDDVLAVAEQLLELAGGTAARIGQLALDRPVPFEP